MAESTIIDFHAHYYPDAIAAKAVQDLSGKAGIEPLGDGTLDSLRNFMKEDGIALSVNQPVATRPDQVESINRAMVAANSSGGGSVYCFGSMHPEFNRAGNVRDEIRFLAENGVKGIKLHPEYQSFYPDDPGMTDIYDACRKHGLLVVFHCGRDLAFETVHATPQRMAQVAKIKNLKIVCAHMGGYRMWDEVETHLLGIECVYFDTGFCVEMENTQMKEIILGHGAHKVLFGSDFPWQRQKDVVAKVKSLDIGANLESQVFYKNARWLLDN